MGTTHRPSASIIVACVALALALTGSAVALPGKNSVQKDDLAKGSVTAKAIKKNAVRSKAIKNGAVKAGKLANGAVTETKLADGAVTGAKVADGSLSSADLSDVENSGLVKVSATPGPSFDEAREVAPKQVLLRKGPLTIYGKCFGASFTYAMVYAETTEPGSTMISDWDYHPGGSNEFLNPGTPENDREVLDVSTAPNNADGWHGRVTAIAPDGSVLEGVVSAFAKNGNGGPSGDGLYGNGDTCLFKASSIG